MRRSCLQLRRRCVLCCCRGAPAAALQAMPHELQHISSPLCPPRPQVDEKMDKVTKELQTNNMRLKGLVTKVGAPGGRAA